ncbi:MAG: sigma-70 family RNA polymerase sigma factor [Gemmatimonadales bacterium]|nr:sigma-70 family RNA polymerase sigma factor [Gemmatimonadales bacterium]
MAPDPAADPDLELLLRAAGGHEPSVAALYDRHVDRLYAVAHRITGERADAEEAVLEGFAQAWRDAARFDRERGSVTAWLTLIVRSRALDLVRARGRRQRAIDAAARDAGDLGAPGMSGWTPNPAADAERGERATRVRAAVALLSPPQRHAMELAFFEELSHTEIAERLGEPLGTIKTRVRLGMQKLREMLEPLHGDGAA